MRHHEYSVSKRCWDYNLYSAVDSWLLSKQSIGANAKTVLSVVYFGESGPTGNVVLLCTDNSNNSYWIVCRFVPVALVMLMAARRWSSLCSAVCEQFALPTWSVAWNGSLPSSRLMILLVVESHDCASAAWCLIPARWIMKANSNMRRRQRASRSIDSAWLSIHLSASKSVWSVNCWRSRYGIESKMDQTISGDSRCVVLYRCLLSVRGREQYAIGFVLLSGCF